MKRKRRREGDKVRVGNQGLESETVESETEQFTRVGNQRKPRVGNQDPGRLDLFRVSPEPWWGDPLAKPSALSVPVAAFGNTTPAESFEAASRRGVFQFASVLDRGLLHSEVMLVGACHGGVQLNLVLSQLDVRGVYKGV